MVATTVVFWYKGCVPYDRWNSLFHIWEYLWPFKINAEGLVVHFYVQLTVVGVQLIDGHTFFIAFYKRHLYIRAYDYFVEMSHVTAVLRICEYGAT